MNLDNDSASIEFEKVPHFDKINFRIHLMAWKISNVARWERFFRIYFYYYVYGTTSLYKTLIIRLEIQFHKYFNATTLIYNYIYLLTIQC